MLQLKTAMRRKSVLCAGILISLSIILWASRQRTWVAPHQFNFPHRISFSERADFWTDQANEAIVRVGGLLRYQDNLGQNLTLEIRNKALDSLSIVVQEQLTRRLNVNHENCSGPTLLCGHFQDCGFACQIHHRMTCVALSYMLGFPLIHDEITGWGFKKKWRDAFQPIGSQCKPGPDTITVYWAAEGPRLSKPRKCFSCGLELVPSFIENGFIVPKEIGELVEQLHDRHFLWWAGQFAKFTLRLTQNQASLVNKAKESIGLMNDLHPTFGLHVRMTDKITEDVDSRHDIKVYFDEIQVFRNKATILTKDLNQIIFIASDNHTILPRARKAYPMEKILGFQASKTLLNQNQRVDALDDIIRDTLVLAEADYVVCGYSSNVCRLLLELLAARYADVLDRVKSLDGKYRYHIHGLVSKQDVNFST